MAFPDVLEQLIEDGVIDGVTGRLMSGKEASVYVVERQGERLAAKVYKAREQRTFKATASYTEGRNQTRNSRDKRAMGKRTSYGKTLIEENWRDIEAQALSQAFVAGVRVPKPFLLHEDVLLMELLVDAEGNPAPRLADCELPRDVAEQLHREIYGQVRLLLLTGKIHGDLSAFNILMARGGPTLIDMPQIVDAAGNNQAREILRRDLRNITEHLARFDARLLRFRDCGEAMWHHYQNGTLEGATEPEEGSVAGGHHRSRRSRDAERGRMGRDRPDGSPAPSGVPDRHGPPREGGPRGATMRNDGQRNGPPRNDGPRNDGPRNGPPRNGPPPRNDAPRDGGQRNDGPRNGPPRNDGQRSDGQRNGPPRNEPPRDGGQRNGPPRDGGRGREIDSRGAAAPRPEQPLRPRPDSQPPSQQSPRHNRPPR